MEDVANEYNGKSDLRAVHVWQEHLPKLIKGILKDCKYIFPQDSLARLLFGSMGHEFRIGLEDDAPLVHRPLYKHSALQLKEE